MWDSKEVTITIRLPHDIPEQAEAVQKSDPEFLSRVVLYGLTRRSICRGIRDRQDETAVRFPVTWAGKPIEPIPEEEGRAIVDENEDRLVREIMLPDPVEEEAKQRRILAENRHHDGGTWAEKAGDR